MQKNDYYVGLDMGTNSVGWAVTDEHYKLMRAYGKDMWGIREFDEARPSQNRRQNRTLRRRYQRQHVRIGLLKDYFSTEISRVDPDFYTRLDNSFYYPEDKDGRVAYKYIIFNDLSIRLFFI